MAPSKRAKKAKAGATKPAVTGATSGEVAQGSKSSLTSFPHILTSIIDNASPSSLAILMRCSKDLHHLAAPKLYRTVHLTTARFSAMIAGHGAKSQPSATLAECFKHTRSLHFELYQRQAGTKGVLADGTGLLPNLSTMILYPTAHWRDKGYSFSAPDPSSRIPPMTLHADQRRLEASSLVIKLSESFVTFWHQCQLHISDLPIHIRSVTMLVPCAWRATFFPTCLPRWEDGTGERRSLTIVLLPSVPPRNSRRNWAGADAGGQSRAGIWDYYHGGQVDYHSSSRALAVRVVGLEYADIDPQSQWISSRLPRFGTTTTTSRFSEWLDEQEPGVLFTADQEAILREDDRITWAQRAEEMNGSSETSMNNVS